jgi:protein ImuB
MAVSSPLLNRLILFPQSERAKPGDMQKRFVAIWFRHLTTDWKIRRQPELKAIPFVFASPERGRMIVRATSAAAYAKGVYVGMVVADCRALIPSLQVFDDKPDLANQLLNALAEWCIRYTPIAAIDSPDGLILDVTGCAHIWGSEDTYLKEIVTRLRGFGYTVRAAMADTIGAAWAVCRYGQITPIISSGGQLEALQPLPPAALRLESTIVERLEKLGLYHIRSFINIPPSALRRRFGQSLWTRINQALGHEIEVISPIRPIEPYQERLPCLEPIRTATGIEIALKRLLDMLCQRLLEEGKGLRRCLFKCFRIDGDLQQIEIGTNRASRNTQHLFKLFENKIATLQPDLGFELFFLEATIVEDVSVEQEQLWNLTLNQNDVELAELLDRIGGKVGSHMIHRYLPQESHLPERSIKLASSINEKQETPWRILPRPIHLLLQPEPIEVMVRIPDYPPLHFRYNGRLHTIKKADGPERIMHEWWYKKGLYRDYYSVEDESGARYWLFRLGDYNSGEPRWFMHGFFA